MVLVPEMITIYGFLKLQLAAIPVSGLAVLNKQLSVCSVHLFVRGGN